MDGIAHFWYMVVWNIFPYNFTIGYFFENGNGFVHQIHNQSNEITQEDKLSN